jgi:hypothetical protein
MDPGIFSNKDLNNTDMEGCRTDNGTAHIPHRVYAIPQSILLLKILRMIAYPGFADSKKTIYYQNE